MEQDMSQAQTAQTLKIGDLPKNRPTAFELVPDAETRRAIAAELGIEAVRKLRLSGEIAPMGKADWQLTATLGATVVQSCVVTLAPVTTRIDEPLSRLYLANMPEPEVEAGAEVEMPENDSQEPLPAVLDLSRVMVEALALALPLYPRAEGAELEDARFAAPGTAPMSDEDARPFAVLKGLRDKLEKDE
jgi:uncharacterized metal-binding protein YceD (DUF177 family)